MQPFKTDKVFFSEFLSSMYKKRFFKCITKQSILVKNTQVRKAGHPQRECDEVDIWRYFFVKWEDRTKGMINIK